MISVSKKERGTGSPRAVPNPSIYFYTGLIWIRKRARGRSKLSKGIKCYLVGPTSAFHNPTLVYIATRATSFKGWERERVLFFSHFICFVLPLRHLILLLLLFLMLWVSKIRGKPISSLTISFCIRGYSFRFIHHGHQGRHQSRWDKKRVRWSGILTFAIIIILMLFSLPQFQNSAQIHF